MRVYIAGHDQEHERAEFEQAARRLAWFGAEVSSPFHPDLDGDHGSWTRTRIEHVLRSDAVVLLPSHGLTCLDELLARTAGIPVRSLDEILSSFAGLQVASA
jgi:hypothetical protein